VKGKNDRKTSKPLDQENEIGPLAEDFVDAPNEWIETTPSETGDDDGKQDRVEIVAKPKDIGTGEYPAPDKHVGKPRDEG